MTAEEEQATALLQQQAKSLGLRLDQNHCEAFVRYQRLLQSWGNQVNLTALRDTSSIYTHHFLDSMAAVAALPQYMAGVDFGTPRVIDVGSGAGFPGMVLALLRPTWRVTLVERVKKKASFLFAVRRELGLSEVSIVTTDAAQLVNDPVFDVALSRAALPPDEWYRLAARLVRTEGLVLSMLSANQAVTLGTILPAGLKPWLRYAYDVCGSQRFIHVWCTEHGV